MDLTGQDQTDGSPQGGCGGVEVFLQSQSGIPLKDIAHEAAGEAHAKAQDQSACGFQAQGSAFGGGQAGSQGQTKGVCQKKKPPGAARPSWGFVEAIR